MRVCLTTFSMHMFGEILFTTHAISLSRLLTFQEMEVTMKNLVTSDTDCVVINIPWLLLTGSFNDDMMALTKSTSQ